MIMIDDVTKGMRVIDADGTVLGKVSKVEPPNPKAADFEQMTAASNQDFINLTLTAIFGASPRVPKEMAAKLFRVGYIKINGHGFWSGSFFAGSDTIDRVEGDGVHLRLNRHELAGQE
jgi:hypothetical protein